jgi:hypothetical protein
MMWVVIIAIGPVVVIGLVIVAIACDIAVRKRACKKYGHKRVEFTATGYRWPGKGRCGVADEVNVVAIRCGRCRRLIDRESWEVTSYEGIQDLGMPSEKWDLLKNKKILLHRE